MSSFQDDLHRQYSDYTTMSTSTVRVMLSLVAGSHSVIVHYKLSNTSSVVVHL